MSPRRNLGPRHKILHPRPRRPKLSPGPGMELHHPSLRQKTMSRRPRPQRRWHVPPRPMSHRPSPQRRWRLRPPHMPTWVPGRWYDWPVCAGSPASAPTVCGRVCKE
jgi:hypothetical protein